MIDSGDEVNRQGLPPSALAPTCLAIGIPFALPDRDPRLHFIDDPAAGGKCRIAMGGADPDPYRHVTDRAVADTMDASGIDDLETGQSFRQNAFTFMFGQFWVAVVMQDEHRPSGMVIAHPAFKGRIGAAARIG